MRTTAVPLGAVLLAAAIKRRGLTPHGFAVAHDLCRIRLAKTLKGELRRVSVDFALDIEAITENEVPVAAWRLAAPRARGNTPSVPLNTRGVPAVRSEVVAEASR